MKPLELENNVNIIVNRAENSHRSIPVLAHAMVAAEERPPERPRTLFDRLLSEKREQTMLLS